MNGEGGYLKNGNSGSLKSLYPLLSYLRKYSFQLLIGFLFIFIQNYSLVRIPVYMKGILDEIVNENRFFIIADMMSSILLFTFIEAVSLYLMRKIIISVSRKIEYKIRQKLFDTLLNFEYPFFLKNETGDISSRLTNDLNDVRVLLGPAVMYVPNAISRIVLFFPILIGLSGTLMIIIVPILIMLVFLIFTILPRLRPKFKKIQEMTALINNRVWQTVTGMTTIKQNTLEKNEADRFEKLNDKYIKVQMDMVKFRSFVRPLFIFIFSLIELVILLLGGSKVISGALTIGELLQFNVMISALTFPILSLGWIMSMIQLGISAMKRINYILEESIEEEKEGKISENDFNSIDVENLSFIYPDTSKKVLNGIKMKIVKGEMVGITGEVGSGKSTFLDILSGLLTPKREMIKINGIDICDLDKESLHSVFSVVSQDPFLFSGSISENIALGTDTPEISDIKKTVSLASLRKDIDSFPNKFDQKVGERGITLSGGQKQRMAIARALYNPAPVLLFDDPLSSVDSETEGEILENLKQIRLQGSYNIFETILIVSHRISTLRECDIIYVFKDGKIIEKGDHDSLVRQKGKYFVLSKMQQMELD